MNICIQCGCPVYPVVIQGQTYLVSHMNKALGGRLVCPLGGPHGAPARLLP